MAKNKTVKEIKAENDELRLLYSELTACSNNPRVVMGTLTKGRVKKREYKKSAIKSIIMCCTWFLDNYPEPYTCLIKHVGTRCHLEIYDFRKKKFATYIVTSKSVVIYRVDIEIYKYHLEVEGIYDEEIHYIADVPILPI